MKKLILPLLAASWFLIGCESTPHYNRTRIVTLAEPLPKKPYGSVKLYQSKREVPGRYDLVALMSVEGRAGEEALFIKAFLYRAADLGADGLLVYRASLTGGAEGGGGTDGKEGGTARTAQQAVFRGEAIHLK